MAIYTNCMVGWTYYLLLMEGKTKGIGNPSLILHSIVACLNQLLTQWSGQSEDISVFNLKTAPTISLSDYLARMFKYMNCSVGCFVYALILIDRLQEYHPQFTLHPRNVHRLILAANVVSAKYLDDFFYKNSFYANVGGVPLTLLNSLQLQFLTLLDFNAHVEQQTFDSYFQRLQLFGDASLPVTKIIAADKKSPQFSNKENNYEKKRKIVNVCRGDREMCVPDEAAKTVILEQ